MNATDGLYDKETGEIIVPSKNIKASKDVSELQWTDKAGTKWYGYEDPEGATEYNGKKYRITKTDEKNKGISVNVNTAEAPDIGTEEQNIENLRGDLDYFDNIIKKGPDKDGNYKVVDSKTRETTTASKEWVEDQKKAKQDRIKSQLKKNVTTVNSKIPKFKESYDNNTPNIRKTTTDKDIDATVDKTMAKETYEARKWMKDYLKDYRRTLD